MAETLTELVAKISTDAAGLKSGLSDAEKATEASSKKMQDSLKKVGTVMAASGAAITAALGLMGKAAIDEEINIKRLATTINNSGTAYDNVKDSLEALIATTQRKTGVADDEQRDILNRLILVTNDYGKALELLPTVLDLAAAGEMDATTAATYLGKAYLELEEGADEVSVRFGQASLQFKNMEDIQNRVAGSAENLANPLSVLKASMGDVAEALGTNLIPLIKDAVKWIVDIAIKIQEWAKEHPELAKTLTLVAAGLGVLLTAVGGLILILPTVISGVAAFGVVFHAALGPIGLISLAITALIAAGILLWQNWDKVSHFFADMWSNMVEVALNAIDGILAGLHAFLGWIPGLGDKIDEARKKIANMIEAEKIKRDLSDLQRGLYNLGKETDNTSKHLGAIGVISEKVAASLDIQKDKVDDLTNAYKQLGQVPLPSSGVETKKTYTSAAERLADEQGMSLSAAQSTIERYATNPLSAEFTPVKGIMEDIVGYQHGGLVENTGLAYLHQGETVIPTNETTGNIIVNFTQPVFFDREDTMNKFVDMIRKGIQRQDRLRFGGAWNGT